MNGNKKELIWLKGPIMFLQVKNSCIKNSKIFIGFRGFKSNATSEEFGNNLEHTMPEKYKVNKANFNLYF